MGVDFQKWNPSLFISQCWQLCPAGPCSCCESVSPCLVASQAAPWFFLHQLCATLPVPLDLPCMECNAAETASREGGGFIVWREVAVFIESNGAWGGGGGGEIKCLCQIQICKPVPKPMVAGQQVAPSIIESPRLVVESPQEPQPKVEELKLSFLSANISNQTFFSSNVNLSFFATAGCRAEQ